MKTNFRSHIMSAFVVTLFLASCFGEHHQKEIEEINDLRVKLNQADSILKTVDHDYAETKAIEVKNNAQFIQFNIDKLGDTLDFKTALFLNYYRALLRSYETVAKSHEALSKQCDSTRTNLANLEHDLKENSLENGLTPEKCIEHEEEQVNYVLSHATGLQPMLDNARASYDTLAPKVARYMEDLNVRLAAKQNMK